MAPSKWDEENEDSTPPSSPPPTRTVRRSKFDDEEDDSDVLESWDAEEDSEVERQKAAKAAEAKAKAEAEAKANKKSKSQRIEEYRQEKMRRRQLEEEESSDEEEDEATRRQRMRAQEKAADMKNAEDLFGALGVSDKRAPKKTVIMTDPSNPSSAVDLSDMKLFKPETRDQFVDLREVLTPLLVANSKKAHYPNFAVEFAKGIARDLSSEQIKKIASGLTTLSNEKMKEEKASEKGGKKSKAAKSKVTLNASRDTTLKADTNVYEDGLDDGDFM